MPFITIRIKGSEGWTRSELDKERLVVGRSSKADVPIQHTSISREHCAIVRDGERWVVEDLGSANGTWVNKTKVDGRLELRERDIIKLGFARLTFHGGHRNDAAAVVDVAGAEDDDDAPKAPVRKREADDPPEASTCAQCGSWFSIAHRLAGDRMDCPRCGHRNTVPDMSL